MRKSYYPYPIEIVEDVFGESSRFADILREALGVESPRILLVADENVVRRTEGLGTKIGRYVQAKGIELAGSPVILVGSEKVKADNLASALTVVEAILEAKLRPTDCLVALGGGSVLDVAGYAASQVRGGVNIVRLPTTPASMIDAAFADYAAVDSQHVKDALRVPSQPSAVVIDPLFMQTVLDGVWRAGFGEAVRHAVVQDAATFRKLTALAAGCQAHEYPAMLEILNLACALRQKKGDTTFGLWAASRLEAMSGYKLPHGYAVSIGACLDASYAVEAGICPAEIYAALRNAIEAGGLLESEFHSHHLLSQTESLLAGLDAWNLTPAGGKIVVPAGLGKAQEVTDVDRSHYATALKKMIDPTQTN